MPQPRHAKKREAFILLAAAALLIFGILTNLRGARAQQGHLIPQLSTPMYPMGYKILSPTAGVDFLPYLTKLDAPLMRTFTAKKPKSCAGAEKGVVVVRVQIQKDGSLPDGAVTIVSSSGNEDVDAAAVNAIHAAAPFARLPEKYSRAYLEMQVRFYFKDGPAEPEPKVVPIERVASHTT
jgi:TonB family protein